MSTTMKSEQGNLSVCDQVFWGDDKCGCPWLMNCC